MKRHKLKQLTQLKELTRYRFNLDKHLFKMKLQRKKMIGHESNNIDTSEYIRMGMAFLPRTTFYTNTNTSNLKFTENKNQANLTDSNGKNSPDFKVHKINAELLKPYTRSLSPIVRCREKIDLEARHSNLSYRRKK